MLKKLTMAYNYGYKSKGTCANGLAYWLQDKGWFTDYKQLNEDLKLIRLHYEPNKPISNDLDKNAIYVSEKLGFEKFKKYYLNR